MRLETLAFPAVIFLGITSISLLVSPNWRFSIAALALQYVGVFVLVALSWPIEMAVAKLVAGWMAGTILAMAVIGAPSHEPFPFAGGDSLESPERLNENEAAGQPRSLAAGSIQTGRIFRLLSAILVLLVVFSLSPQIIDWVNGISLPQAWGGLILFGMGLLQLGFTGKPFRTILGLLTVISGFEILYAAVESSTLVAGLLAAVILSLAMAGAYLITAPYMEEAE